MPLPTYDQVCLSPTEPADTEPRLGYVLDEHRRVALAEVDNAKFSWFHVKVCMVAGIGFFTDAYDIFAINIAATMLGYVYGQHDPEERTLPQLTPAQELGIKVATPVGTLFGQLIFGHLADRLGRKRMYGVELIIMVIATFAQSVSGTGHAESLIGVLIVWRFIMGLGIGGDYPLSAVIASEFASTQIRGRMMTAVFANQGWGQCAAALVGLIVTAAYKQPILNDQITDLKHVDFVWRILIGLGCVPGVAAMFFRITLPESPRFTMDIELNIKQASRDIYDSLGTESTYPHDAPVAQVRAPKAGFADSRRYFGKWENLKVLIGTSYSWFALDIAFYGLGLNSTVILEAIKFGTTNVSPDGPAPKTLDVYNNLFNSCAGNLILSLGLIPGYWMSFAFIDTWGRKPIQLMGFTVLTVLFITMGSAYHKLIVTSEATKGFVALYCLSNFFLNFGPNTTTFIVPGEVFPTRYRSTGHGISAASGKLGAIIAQVSFYKLQDAKGSENSIRLILLVFGIFMFTGVFSTLLIPEPKRRTLEELSNEDQYGFLKEIGTSADVHALVMGTGHNADPTASTSRTLS
ncbi:MFS general substrate transporter [Pluteus cervinus]|uniref:MFS general substrate transporter n=1 Tax=Pluteus cervinus TaxID=181527 RepID=A0ACD3A321_9AGAR|nr:MFS general substrate transporter [Pluteus cervinus]